MFKKRAGILSAVSTVITAAPIVIMAAGFFALAVTIVVVVGWPIPVVVLMAIMVPSVTVCLMSLLMVRTASALPVAVEPIYVSVSVSLSSVTTTQTLIITIATRRVPAMSGAAALFIVASTLSTPVALIPRLAAVAWSTSTTGLVWAVARLSVGPPRWGKGLGPLRV